ncbi:TonB family protein [Rhodanobacter sp. 7MK24]|uniref:energy transducer TonB family protein n=1 Tax=Rhodanobacter sp. 7MK24 TaxID=2775922 RepID=UPI00177A7E78|nr:energy transducer TonB [Rhodanobacter sp. 7MK24]MBD8880246.1 TonB family protein [Rhodanobacter sp. 7MK24]
MRKRWIVLALLAGLAGCVPPSQHRAMLDGAPWPLDADGNIVTGETVLLILVDYHGVAVEACIEKSSGNNALDASALRRTTTSQYNPEIKNGFFASAYARVPVNFVPEGTPSVALPPVPPHRECQPQPVPGVSPAELALVSGKQFTISPTQAREVPGVDQPWPTDANGRPVTVDAWEKVLVDTSGRIVAIDSLKPSKYPAFSANAAQTVAKMTFASSDVQHWDVVSFHFHGGE